MSSKVHTPPRTADPHPHRRRLLGAPIDAVTLDEAAEACAGWSADAGAARNVISVNAKTVMVMRSLPTLQDALERAALIVADGVSVTTAARILGVALRGRGTGIDLMVRILESASREGHSCYFLGARPEVIEGLLGVLPERYPGLIIAGAHHGYFERHNSPRIVEDIRNSGARILFVAFGQPEAELWCEHHGPATGAALTMSVGGSFDVISGTIRRSPVWMQRVGIEWLWRFLLEPRKRFKVIFVDNLRFLWLVFRERFLGGGTPPPA